MENQPGKRDIFGSDSRFGEPKPQPKTETTSLKEGATHIGKGSFYLLKGLKHIALIKVPMNLIALVIIIAATFYATNYFNEPTINANVVFAQNTTGAVSQDEFSNLLKTNCEVTEWAANLTVACPECEACPMCPEVTCENQTRTELVYRYRCSDGRITNASDECAPIYPAIDSPYLSEANDMAMSIDEIEYSLVTNTTYQIRKIGFTILNKKDRVIVPQIEVKVYNQWADVINADPNRIIKTSEIKNTLEPGTGFRASVPVVINFEESWTMRLELINTSTDPDERLVSVTRKIII